MSEDEGPMPFIFGESFLETADDEAHNPLETASFKDGTCSITLLYGAME